MANIKDVAKRAGVSVTTVSRVINNRGYIGKETRKKVEKAMAEIDYSPNQIARALQRSQSFLIGVVVPDSGHPFFAELIKNIELFAYNNNYKLLICNSLDEAKKEAKYISMLRENRVDGIIMCSQTLDVEEYKKVQLPIVSFDRILSNNIPYVSSDNFNGGTIATEHLIKSGCKRLLHISGPLNLEMLSNRRADAFKLTCMKYDIPHAIIEGEFSKQAFTTYPEDFVKNNLGDELLNYDGVFCSNDILAYALYMYAQKMKINVPQQLKIVGYDYTSFTRILQTPKLTTIQQPADQIGKELCSALIKMIENKDSEVINNTIVDVALIKGDTT
ncbi:LacI family transcriptional regulator, sucrose operon repressor [Evansella caseinilytica]|uniref:LacI family transcriptional regulator, sucrose operon repressor n=1 Tax=Evansella caseinilytica TaxID=1503961 RepID=A0A1H3I8J3_9BACI|nr:LacI family DNA-binding transcriptional regulator [Evansella caseinilytica]SDY23264.1 LacI family transcriptional regulator, sucrose operon repressor [Evansella caseinilytica]